jgi:sugar lactone lactonase YvrE
MSRTPTDLAIGASVGPVRRSPVRLQLARLAAALIGLSGLATVMAVAGTGSPLAGAAASTPVNSIYVLNEGTSLNSSLGSFAPGSTGNAVPTSTVTGTGTSMQNAYYMAMDPSGNVWVVNYGSSTVVEYTQAQLAAGGSPVPTVTLSANAGSLNQPTALAFDRSGDLWVTNQPNAPATGTVVEFTPSQLAASGSPVPTVTLGSSGTGAMDGPISLAFDGSGDLWIGSLVNNTIIRLTPAQLATSGSPTPAVVLGATANSIDEAYSITFDRSGNLWVANNGAGGADVGTLVAFSPTQLTSSGSPVPHVTLASNGTNLNAPDSLTFDPFGNLWVSDSGTNAVVEFTPTQLTTSGTPVPVSTLAGSNTRLDGPIGVLFVPATGYTLAATDGGIFNYGGSGFFGSTGSLTLNSPVVGMAQTPDGLGYWLVAGDGGVFNFGDGGFYGSHGGSHLNKPIVGMAATPDGKGYWLVASDGGIFTYGDATFYGSHGGSALNQPIVGMAATPDGKGYWLVASDGGIFTYGDATFYGSHGGSPLTKPIVGIAATPDGGGYWLVASDGGIFNYGDAGFYGSAGSIPLNEPIVGMAATPSGGGYWLVASDGGVFNYGNAAFSGSHGGSPLNKPIVAMSGPYG